MSFRLSLRSVDPQFQPLIFVKAQLTSSAALHPRNHGPAGIIVGTGPFHFLNQVTLATEIQGDPRGRDGHLLGMAIDASKYDWLDHMFQYVPIKTWWKVVGVPVFEEPGSVSWRKSYWKLAKIDGPNDLNELLVPTQICPTKPWEPACWESVAPLK